MYVLLLTLWLAVFSARVLDLWLDTCHWLHSAGSLFVALLTCDGVCIPPTTAVLGAVHALLAVQQGYQSLD